MKKSLLVALVFGASSTFAAKVTMTPAELLSRVHSVNQEEIHAGELALKKAHSPEVRTYAQRLIKDHKKADSEVIALAKLENVKLTSMPMPKSMHETGKLVEHIGMTAKLKTLGPGRDFDKAFLEGMYQGHSDVIAELENVDTSDPQMKRLIAKLLPELHHHQQIAKSLRTEVIKEAR